MTHIMVLPRIETIIVPTGTPLKDIGKCATSIAHSILADELGIGMVVPRTARLCPTNEMYTFNLIFDVNTRFSYAQKEEEKVQEKDEEALQPNGPDEGELAAMEPPWVASGDKKGSFGTGRAANTKGRKS